MTPNQTDMLGVRKGELLKSWRGKNARSFFLSTADICCLEVNVKVICRVI